MPTRNPHPPSTVVGSANPDNTGAKKSMIYEKCITCPDVGRICNGPNMLTLPIEDVREMVRLRKKVLGLTNEQLAVFCNIPKGTIDRFLSDADTDFKYTTVCEIIRGIIRYGQPAGEQLGDNPCPATSSEIRQQKEEDAGKLAAAEAECQQLRDKLTATKGNHIEQMNDYRQDQQRRVDYLKADVKLWRRFTFILGGILIIVFFALLSYVIWDLTHRDAGFFQW